MWDILVRHNSIIIPHWVRDFQASSPHISNVDVLSRWFWLDKATVKAIDLGNFDINQLPKLQREESARNHYLAKTPDGFRMSLDGSKFELITTRTKLQSTFTNLELFLSAWQVYISIRTHYHPEYSSSLAFWTERFIYHASIHPWDVVLNYAIAYFQAHQQDPSAYWFRPDSDLITDIIMSTPSHSVLNMSLKPTISRANKINDYDSDICQNWNRSECSVKETIGDDCMHLHVCNICFKEDHKASQCPEEQSDRTSIWFSLIESRTLQSFTFTIKLRAYKLYKPSLRQTQSPWLRSRQSSMLCKSYKPSRRQTRSSQTSMLRELYKPSRQTQSPWPHSRQTSVRCELYKPSLRQTQSP